MVRVRASDLIGPRVRVSLAGAALFEPILAGRAFVSMMADPDLPHSLTYACDFGRALGRVLGRPAVAPLPAAAVKAMFGEMGERLLLEVAFVRPARLAGLGFRWALPDLDHAFRFETGNIR